MTTFFLECNSRQLSWNRGGYRGGAMGAITPPPGQGCLAESCRVPQVGHILHRKCPMWGKFRGKSAPHRADFAVKVSQVGHILRRKCPRWGTFYGESAPGHRCRTRYLPQIFFFAPPPENSCIRPCWKARTSLPHVVICMIT